MMTECRAQTMTNFTSVTREPPTSLSKEDEDTAVQDELMDGLLMKKMSAATKGVLLTSKYVLGRESDSISKP